jgi:hypothetical protein
MEIVDWNGRAIRVARSRGGVLATADFADNLIRTDTVPWPPPAVVQKLYESRQSRAFDADELAVVAERLGVYSDMQSIHSEDAITWNYFGPLAVEPPAARAAFLDWLLARVDLTMWAGSATASIDLWRRVPHPDKSLPGGPELDFVIDGDRCVVFGEVKWRSGEGRGQGRAGNKGQMQLRRDFFTKYGSAVYGDRGFAVLGVSLGGPLETETPADAHGIATRSIAWAELAEFDSHPSSEEFRRYYEWKLAHSQA